MRTWWGRRSRRLLVVSAALFLLAAGIGYATIPDSNHVYTACMLKNVGTIRLIDHSLPSSNLLSHCTALETQISWNQTGPQGPPGPPGPQGPPGSPPGPANLTVDCTAGQSVQQALDNHADATSVDITIKGTCTESVQIARDHVTLRVANPGDGLAAPGPNANVLTVFGGRSVQLNGLSLTGGGFGLLAANGAGVNAIGISISGVNNQDVSSGGGAALLLSNSTVSGGNEGVSAQAGGSVNVIGGTISGVHTFSVHAQNGGSITLGGGALVTGDGNHAVVAQDGGTVLLQTATVQNSGGIGVLAFQGGSVFVTANALVQGNEQGGVAANAGVAEVDGHVTGNQGCGVCGYNGGQVTIQDGAIVDNNNGEGVQASLGSTVAVQGAIIEGNTGNGIHLAGTSSADFNGMNTITGNGQWGIFCNGPPAVAQIKTPPAIDNISGNAAGQVDCPET